MIIEVLTCANSALSPMTTHAASETADYIARQSKEERRRMQASYALGLGAMGVDELYRIVEQCSNANWDGYGAMPVTRETFIQACNFMEALPLGTTAPSVGAEPDGHLTLEWYRSSRRILSVSISPEGELHYAALLGHRKIYGTEPFWGEVPRIILDIIHLVEPNE